MMNDNSVNNSEDLELKSVKDVSSHHEDVGESKVDEAQADYKELDEENVRKDSSQHKDSSYQRPSSLAPPSEIALDDNDDDDNDDDEKVQLTSADIRKLVQEEKRRRSRNSKQNVPNQKLPAPDLEEDGEDEAQAESIRNDKDLEYHLTAKKPEKKPKTRYTPIFLRDPRKFVDAGYKIHLQNIKLFIVITMYNEEPDEMVLTLRGICDNVRIMMKKMAAPELWKQIAVCIVSDGREKANKATLNFLSDIGLYSEKKVQKVLKAKDPETIGCHLFEGTATFVDHPDLGTYFPPLQMMFALKEHNAGKIDSHWWFFEAFSQYLKPEYCFLIDVGTKPRRKAFFHLYRAFERNDQIAGACGQITTRNVANFNPIIAAQHFEYKIANLLDKAMESICGFISVLPGAFSAYRFEALNGEPLRKYFHHIEARTVDTTPFEANMYLAEDRILCFELFARKDCSYTLHYVKDSIAETDVPTTLVDLLKQRRRWINGSFFAMLYAILGFYRVLSETNHSFSRKLVSIFEFGYYLISIVLNWLLIGCFYLTTYFAVKWIFANNTIAIVFLIMLVAAIILQFLCGLSEKPIRFANVYRFSSFFLGVMFTFVSAYTLYYIITTSNNDYNWLLLMSLGVSFGIYIFAGLLYRELLSVFLSFSQYWFMIPTFVVIFTVYSMCNVHDISWGTKNLDTSNVGKVSDAEFARKKKEAEAMRLKQEQTFLNFRLRVVFFWVLCNGALVAVFTLFSDTIGSVSFLFIIFCIVLYSNGVRLFGSIMYWISIAITRAEEKDQNNVEKRYFRNMRRFAKSVRDESGYAEDNSGMTCMKFWFVFVRPRTWVAISNTLFVSGLIGISAAAWCLVTGALSVPLLLLFPIGPFAICGFALSWRLLARMEFEFNSNDGHVARILGIDSTAAHRSALKCPPVNVEYKTGEYFLYMRTLLSDHFTFKALLYFLVPKLIVFGISWFFAVGFFGVSLLLIFQGSMRTGCTAGNDSLICIGYNAAIAGDWHSFEWLKWLISNPLASIISVPLGIVLFILTCHFVNWLDSRSRSLASHFLGEQILTLQDKRKMMLAKREQDDEDEDSLIFTKTL